MSNEPSTEQQLLLDLHQKVDDLKTDLYEDRVKYERRFGRLEIGGVVGFLALLIPKFLTASSLSTLLTHATILHQYFL